MCAVSMIYDHYIDKWQQPTNVPMWPSPTPQPPRPITQEEVDEFRKLLERAREYDKKMNQPDCELESKKKTLRDLADKLGVKIDFV